MSSDLRQQKYSEYYRLINQTTEEGEGAALLVSEKGHGSIYGSVFNLTNSAIGTGILALPFAVSQCGLILGPVLMLVFASLMSYTLLVVCETAMLHPAARSYETLVRDALGSKASLLMASFITFQTFGSCTSYMIVIADSFTPILAMICGDAYYAPYIANRYVAAASISIFFLLPLAVQKQMHHLRFSSTLSVLCVCYIVFVVVNHSYYNLEHLQQYTIMYATDQPLSILTSLPLIIFAFRSHTGMPPIHKELQDNHILRRSRCVVFFTMIICAFLYYVTCIFGYLDFFSETKPNILNNFSSDDILASVARGLVTFVMICHYPVVAYCCRSALDFLIFGDKPLTTRRHVIETFLMWACCFGTSIAVPSITVVLGLVGSIPVSDFLFPSFFLYKFHDHKKWKGIKGRFAMVLACFYGTFSIIIAVLCSSSIVYKNWIHHN